MATHRRGTRPAQWPVRDLLAQRRPTTGGPRDPRLLAAVSGLLACGAAAATVAFSATDGRLGVGGPEPSPGPVALPAPGTAAPAPTDPGADPAVPGRAAPGPTGAGDPGSTRPGWGGGGPSGTRAAPAPPAAPEGSPSRGWRVAPQDRPSRVALPPVDLVVAGAAGRSGVLMPLPREVDIGAAWSRYLATSCTGADGGRDEDPDRDEDSDRDDDDDDDRHDDDADDGHDDDGDDSHDDDGGDDDGHDDGSDDDDGDSDDGDDGDDGDDPDEDADRDHRASDRASDDTADHAAARRPALAILVAACGDSAEQRIDAAAVLAALDELDGSDGRTRGR